MARFVVVPQWQGSPSARAMALGDGAQAIAGDLPRAACTVVDVPLEAGESLDTGVHRASALLRVRATVGDVVAEAKEHVVVIGGDCSVTVPAVAALAGGDLAVVWFDAHPDLHTPDTSPSGAYAGMALRAVMGEGAAGLVVDEGVPAARVVLAGVRDADPAEAAVIAERRMTSLPADDLTAAPTALAEAVAATGATRVFVHVDLDVLDPADVTGVSAATPFGLSPATLTAAIGALRSRVPLAGATIAGFAPASPAAAVEDLGTILRIIGALA